MALGRKTSDTSPCYTPVAQGAWEWPEVLMWCFALARFIDHKGAWEESLLDRDLVLSSGFCCHSLNLYSILSDGALKKKHFMHGCGYVVSDIKQTGNHVIILLYTSYGLCIFHSILILQGKLIVFIKLQFLPCLSPPPHPHPTPGKVSACSVVEWNRCQNSNMLIMDFSFLFKSWHLLEFHIVWQIPTEFPPPFKLSGINSSNRFFINKDVLGVFFFSPLCR